MPRNLLSNQRIKLKKGAVKQTVWVEHVAKKGKSRKSRYIKKHVDYRANDKPSGPPCGVANDQRDTSAVQDDMEVHIENVDRPHAKRSQNRFMNMWLTSHLQEFERTIMAIERPRDPRKCDCGNDAMWRCKDCFAMPETCARCCREKHTEHPFHRVEEWNALGFYEDSWLHRCGLIIHCGHYGAPCNSHPVPAVPCDATPTPVTAMDVDDDDVEYEDEDEDVAEQRRDERQEIDEEVAMLRHFSGHSRPLSHDGDSLLLVVDVTGIHHLPIRYCRCENAKPLYLQLLGLKLYPTSYSQPRTAFTFAVLEDFILHNRECKTTQLSYFSMLCRRTNPTFPHTIPDRYREFIRVTRQWRFLQLRSSSGIAHDGWDPKRHGQMVQFCAACPQPGINLPNDWKTQPHLWRFRPQYVMDGNFAAEHMRMKHPEDDVWLFDGDGFFVRNSPYQDHLRIALETREKSTCNDHHAVNASHIDRNSLRATGIGATCCARHGCFVPHTVVDFQKGERQMNMDYSFSQACSRTHPSIDAVVIMYDVVCQWYKRLPERIAQSTHLQRCFEDLKNLKFIKGIGLFHVHGHQSTCLPRYSPDFIAGIGQVDGEVIETLWSILNDVSRCCRTMTAAHRQEVIDDHMNYSNWAKMTRLVTRIVKKLQNATRMLEASQAAFQETNNGLPEDARARLSALEQDALLARIGTPEAMDIFDVNVANAPGKVERQLILTRMEQRPVGNARGTAGWIANGIKLQEQQLQLASEARELAPHASAAEKLQHVQKLQRLAARIQAHEVRANVYLASHLAEDNIPAMRYVAPNVQWVDSDLDEDDGGIDEQINAADNADDGEDDELPSYRWQIPLPSGLLPAEIVQRRLQPILKTELELRRGQAEDRLREIRVQLAFKSLLWRRKDRPLNTYNTRNRASAEVRKIAKNIRRAVSQYEQARRVLYDHTGTDTEEGKQVRKRYRVIKKEDMKISTEFLSYDIRGNRNTPQSWIWRVNVGNDQIDDALTEEYRRVVWLRAKAQRDRWQEEIILLQSELDWTGRYFDHQTVQWKRRAEYALRNGQGEGYACYAKRRSRMWGVLRAHAIDAQRGV